MMPPTPKEDAYGMAETAALLEQVDRFLEDAARRMAKPPCSRADGSDLVAQLSQLEVRLREYLTGAREAVTHCEQNKRIVATDQARIYGDRAREHYQQAEDAIRKELEQHRRNERDIQQRLVAISATVGQLCAWQLTRPLVEPPMDFHRQRCPRDLGDFPPWSQQWGCREVDDLLRRPIPEDRPLRRRPPLV